MSDIDRVYLDSLHCRVSTFKERVYRELYSPPRLARDHRDIAQDCGLPELRIREIAERVTERLKVMRTHMAAD